jgi:predicted RNase H-like HicB family nuclease
MKTFTAYIEFDPESNLYVGMIPSVPGAHTQAETLDELYENLKEVLSLCLEEYDGDPAELPRFVGIQQIELA